MKEYKFGNSTVIVHSPLLDLPEDEREKWVDAEMEKGNPVLMQIAKTVNESYRKFYKGDC